MRIFMRIVLTVYLLFIIFITGVVLACTWGVITAEFPNYWVSLIYSDGLVRFVVSAAGVAVILLSIAFMFSGARKRKPKSAVIKLTGVGAISITLNAIEEMAIRHITAHEAVRNARAAIKLRDSKVRIKARLALTEGSNIPEVLLSLQTSLKEHIETLAGIEVSNIQLLVEKTSQVVKARVE